MNEIMNFIPLLSIFGAATAFIWSMYQFFSTRKKEEEKREFDIYHRIIKELVEPTSESGTLYIDRQCAIIFELRFFHRYHEVTNRILCGLREKWISISSPDIPISRLIKEIDLTTKYIENYQHKTHRRIFRKIFL